MKERKFQTHWSSGALRSIPPLLLLIGGLLFGGNGVCVAQATNSGDVRGIVTDATGAVIPGATITARDVDKNVSYTFTSGDSGLYDTGPITPDHYLFTFTKDGFKSYVRGPITVDVDVITVNAKLAVGETTEQVVVTTEVPLLNTESGALESTLNSENMAQLPMTGSADWQQFIFLQPGASDQRGTEGGNQGQSSAVNGNMPYDSVLADGASTVMPMSQNSETTIFETTAEVKISSNGFSAQYGTGNIVYNQITKSGSDHFHGAAYDYIQNNIFNAASYGFGTKVTVPVAHYNNFGFAIGGPVKPLKNIFFYFVFDKTVNNGAANNGFITLPTTAEKAGDFTAPGLPTLYDPTTQTLVTSGTCTYTGPQYPGGALVTPAPCVQRQSFASEYGNGNVIPQNMINPAAKAIQALLPNPNVAGTIGSNGIAQSNYAYSEPNQSPVNRYFGRIDWNISPDNRLTMTDTQGDNPTFNHAEGFCPIDCQTGDIDHNNSQVSDVWTINQNLVNEARVGYAQELSAYEPTGRGQGWASKLNMPMLVADIFPSIYLSNFHSPAAASDSVYMQGTFDLSDVVMLIKGRHMLHFGGEFVINRSDSTNWGHTNSASLSFNGQYTSQGGKITHGYDGVDYADFLLGQSTSWSAWNSPEFGGRFKSPQLFVQDDWKPRPNLTVNLGVRWEGLTGWREAKNNETTWDPAVTSMDVSSSVGAGYGQVIQGGMWYEAQGENGRTSLQKPKYNIVLPRAGFSWEVRPNTVVKGGLGVYAADWSVDRYGGGLGQAIGGSGNLSDTTDGMCPVVQADSNGQTADVVDAGCGSGNLNGTSIMSAYLNSPTTTFAHQGPGQSVGETPYLTPVATNYQWTLGVQRQFAGNYSAEVDYVGNKGRNLPYQVDINQVPQSELGPNDQQYSPYPLQAAINGNTNNGYSNYNALEVIVNKRMNRGLTFSANYVWSHFLDTMDSSGWGGQQGNQTWQIAYSPKSNYGNSNWDIRQALKGQVVYQLPFGKGGQFLHDSLIEDEVFGGWQISGTLQDQSGNPMMVYNAQDTSNSVYGGANGFAQFAHQVGSYKTASAAGPYHSLQSWFNGDTSAFGPVTPYTFGDFGRDQIVGPGYMDIKASLGKTFDLYPERGIKFQLRADVDNLPNHPSWQTPGGPSGVGVGPGASASPISGTSLGGRSIQFYGRLSF